MTRLLCARHRLCACSQRTQACATLPSACATPWSRRRRNRWKCFRWATLTVADNVRLVLELNDVDAAESRRRIDSLLDAVGLADRADSYPDVLSGGEQQRVAIARALANRPPLILADEPTGNLDEATADRVLDLLDRLVRQQGGTMLVATHSATVASFCDRVMQIHDGRIDDEPGTTP